MKIYDYEGRKNICGKRAGQARRTLGISQAKLAERLQLEGVTIERDSISRIEAGVRFVADYELLTLSRVLNFGIDRLPEEE